jgi:hypothetical protein
MVSNLGEMERGGAASAAAIERQRIGTLLANAPQLTDQIPLEAGQDARSLALAPDGQHFAVATFWPDGRRAVRQYRIADRQQLWSTATDDMTHNLALAKGSPHGMLRYSSDGARIIVGMQEQPVFAAPATPDQIALDASTGQVLQPPQLPDGFSDLVYDDDARHAILRWRSDASLRFPDYFQFYRVADWTPVGPVHQDRSSMWLFAPDGMQLLRTPDFQRFEMLAFADLQPRWQLDVGDAALVRAWRFSPDGRYLALGGLDGSVRLIDAASGAVELLPAAPVTTIRWLEFDGSSSTLAALSQQGQVMVWDVPSRQPRIAPLLVDDVLELGRVRLSGGMLALAHGHAISMFQLPPLAPFDNEAVPIPARVLGRRPFMAQSFALDAQRRLLITGGVQGVINLWQLPPAPLRGEKAAPLAPVTQGFDGRHLVTVDGSRVSLIDLNEGRSRWAPLEHPQAVDFAELTHDGRWLVTIAQRTLRVFEAETGALRGQPLVLRGTPLLAELAAATQGLLLVFGTPEATGFVERAQWIDLRSADLPSREVVLPRLSMVLKLDPFGRYLLLNDPNQRTLHKLDLDAVPACDSLALPDINQVGELAIADDGLSVYAHLSLGRRQAAILHWDLGTCRHRLFAAEPHIGLSVAMLARGDRVMAHRHRTQSLAIYDREGLVAELPTLPAARTMALLGASADGRRVALATRNAVQIYDAALGERLSSLLTAPIPGHDGIQRIAIAADGSRVLARSIFGRWLVWDLPEAGMPITELEQLARTLDPVTTAANAEAGAVARVAPAGRMSAQSAPPDVAPQRLAADPSAAVDPRFVPVDLDPIFNVRMGTAWNRMAAQGGDISSLAPGIHRLGGIDWRIGGGVQLSGGGPALSLHAFHPHSTWAQFEPRRVARLHVLMLLHVPMRSGTPPRVAGRVRVREQGGREHALEILSVRDVVTHWQPDLAAPEARVAWRGNSPTHLRDGDPYWRASHFYAVTLTTDPEWPALEALRLEIGDGPMEAPLYYAVTLEVAQAEEQP